MKELVNIQNSLKAPKNQFNKFGGYNYRSAEDIMEAVKPLLFKESCTLIVTDEIKEVGGRVYVSATAILTNREGVTISTTAYAREEESKKGMDAAQVTGSASSYARKYALNGLFCIDDTRDPDATNTHGKEKADKAELDLDAISKEIQGCTDRTSLSKVWKKYEPNDTSGKIKELVSAKMKDLGIKSN